MKKFKLLLLALLPMILFSGCLHFTTKVNLNQDGSGTIEEVFLMKSSVVSMMKEFILSFDSTKAEGFDLFKEDELKTKASNYGEGVQYVSGEKINSDGYEGFKVIYSFKDINKIKINPSPEDKIPLGEELGEGNEGSVDDNLKFTFKKGNPSTLVINFPEPDKSIPDSSGDSEYEMDDSTTNADQMQKLMEMFDGMKMGISLNFNGKIKETDASYIDGSEITLMEIDFSEIIKHKDILENLEKSKPETLEEFKNIVGDLPGIKLETKEKVTTKFQ